MHRFFLRGQTPNRSLAVIANKMQMTWREDKEKERVMKAELMGGMMAAVISAGRGKGLKTGDII